MISSAISSLAQTDWGARQIMEGHIGIAATAPIDGTDAGPAMSAMSPDALLSYCQMQLGTIDGEIGNQMNSQQLQLRQRTAVEEVQSALEACGSQGPANGDQMKPCVDAFDKAITELGPNDPVARQLAAKRQKMIDDYGYSVQPPTPATTETNPETGTQSTNPGDDGLHLTKPPANEAWKGTTDGVGNLMQDVRSSAEIGMLKLQDLVSKRQQAVELITGIMAKTDQTLEDGAKAIGR
jgi:hypothetical protein